MSWHRSAAVEILRATRLAAAGGDLYNVRGESFGVPAIYCGPARSGCDSDLLHGRSAVHHARQMRLRCPGAEGIVHLLEALRSYRSDLSGPRCVTYRRNLQSPVGGLLKTVAHGLLDRRCTPPLANLNQEFGKKMPRPTTSRNSADVRQLCC